MNFQVAFFCFLVSYCVCTPKDRVIKEPDLSSAEHFGHDGEEDAEHNPEYDHEAFLGKEDAKAFDELSPEESKEKLGFLFDKIDKDDDTFVTEQEMKDWIHLTQNRYILKDVEKQMETHDLDSDGKITWEEYKKETYGFMDVPENKDTTDEEKKHFEAMVTRDKRRFDKADIDGNKALTKEEYGAFLHPENQDHMKDLVVDETLEDIDKDKDGFISLEEYIGDLYPESEHEKEEPEWVTSEKKQFKELRDKNSDGKMDKSEVREWILPTEFDNVASEAKHLINESDADKDGKLSKSEMLDKHDLFVGSQATDFGEALTRHDEF